MPRDKAFCLQDKSIRSAKNRRKAYFAGLMDFFVAIHSPCYTQQSLLTCGQYEPISAY